MLTASGGPFRGRSREQLADVTVEQALAHPTWSMGPVVTINSRDAGEQGLEVIEAHLLFDLPFDRIDVVVHPQSVVHSMVEFVDGSTLAQASPPDMRLPIALGLAWPDRVPGAAAGVRLDHGVDLGVLAAGRGRLPGGAPGQGRGSGRRRVPAVFNAANEECVDAFLDGPASVPATSSTLSPGSSDAYEGSDAAGRERDDRGGR